MPVKKAADATTPGEICGLTVLKTLPTQKDILLEHIDMCCPLLPSNRKDT